MSGTKWLVPGLPSPAFSNDSYVDTVGGQAVIVVRNDQRVDYMLSDADGDGHLDRQGLEDERKAATP